MAAPPCSICGRTLSVVSQTVGTLYDGIGCSRCKRIICMDCLAKLGGLPPGKPCPRCGGQVKPAYLDVVAALPWSVERRPWWKRLFGGGP